MKKLKQDERAALQATAQDFFGEKRVALKIVTLKQPMTADTKPRLRSDRVVQRMMRQLRKASGETLPKGAAIILTMSAPIRLPGKTALELEKIIRTLLPRRSKPKSYTVHGNQITLRMVKTSTDQQTKLIGLVHHHDSDASALSQIAETLLKALGTAVIQRASTCGSNLNCLALIIDGASWPIGTYRQVISQMSPNPSFSKTMLVATRKDTDLAIAPVSISATLAAS